MYISSFLIKAFFPEWQQVENIIIYTYAATLLLIFHAAILDLLLLKKSFSSARVFALVRFFCYGLAFAVGSIFGKIEYFLASEIAVLVVSGIFGLFCYGRAVRK